MVYFNRSFIFILFVSYFLLNVICLSGCAISGCGNPVSTNSVENTIDKELIKQDYPEYSDPPKKYRIKRRIIKGKYYESI